MGVRFRTIEPNTTFAWVRFVNRGCPFYEQCSQNGHFKQKHRLSCNFANYKSYDGKIVPINQYLRTESIVLAVSATVVVYCYLQGVEVRGVRLRHVPLAHV